MPNRTRNKQLNLKFTNDEFEYIKAKKTLKSSKLYRLHFENCSQLKYL